MARDKLGDFEYQVLTALMRLRPEDSYGVPLRRELAKKLHRDVSVGALYTTLDRLKAKKYVDATWGEPTAERGGKPKKFFAITGLGQAAVQRTEAIAREIYGSGALPEGVLA